MKKSLYKLEQISEKLNSHQTYYSFNKQDENLSLKYRKGRVNAAKWLNELIYHFIQKESMFLEEFKEHIQNQKQNIKDLPNGDFKKGLFDELTAIEGIINDKHHNH